MRMMKLPPIAKIRIPILLALGVGEIASLLHFYGQPKFFQFAVLSIEGILLTFPLLWFNTLRQRGVDGFNIFIAILLGINVFLLSRSSLSYLEKRETNIAQESAVLALFMVFIILLKMLRPHYGSIAKDVMTFLFTFVLFIAWTWQYHASYMWIIIVSLWSLWFAWRTVFHIRNWEKTRKGIHITSDDITTQGGCA
jgi:hypothetical protein